MTKKTLLFGLLLYVGYLAGGGGLIATGVIDKLYFFPGWSIKGPHHDKSTVAADGPLVFKRGNQLVVKQIITRGDRLVCVSDTVPASAPLVISCFAGDVGRAFRVPLRGAENVPAAQYPAPEKLLAVSDIEGNFDGFAQLLRGAGVVNTQLAWQFGRGHLVLVGDFFDRGLNVTECLWLIYKLEAEAERVGGKVHFILGNHERMNLTGHFKYVRRKYLRNADTLGVAYAQWYDRTTVLGQWLRTKNVVEKIGSVVFVHGGISPEVAAAGLSLNQLNELARAGIDAPVATLSPLARQVSQPPGSLDWYRGLALAEPTEAEVAEVLRRYGATAMVLGHTPMKKITTLYQQKVIAIDLPHQQLTDEGQPLQALWLEGRAKSVIDSQGRKSGL